ncbi:hypothetical protein DFQ26_008229 [Actinomortierella ambigua]|nr:hypothetical protein DFQ26_008229 [Actinomortierella ambigua]
MKRDIAGKDDPTAPEKLRRVLRKVPFPVTVITTCSPSDPSIRRGITVSSFSSISLQPDALIAFCVKLPSRVSTLLHESNRFVVQFLAQDQIPHSVAFSSSGAPKKKKKRAEEDLELEGTSAGQVLSEAAKQTLKPDSSPISEKQSGSLSSSSSSTVASTTTTSSPPLAFSEEDPDPFLVLGHKTDPETGIPVLEGTMGAVRCRTHKVMVVGDHEMWIGHVEKVLYGSAMVEDSVQTMKGATPIEQQELWYGFVVNRKGGGGKGGQIWDSIVPRLATAVPKGQWKVEFTQRPGHASDLASELVNAGFNVVVAVGGDGTISQVVNGYMLADGKSKGCSIGIISTGTGGDFVRTLNVPRDPIKALDVVLNNASVPVDVGHVSCNKPNSGNEKHDQYFINICSVGISGNIIRSVEKSPLTKHLSGGLVYWIYTYLNGLVYKPPAVKYTIKDGAQSSEHIVELQGEQQKKPQDEQNQQSWDDNMNLYVLAVANGKYFGGNMRVAPNADVSDGKFDVVCLQNLTLIDALMKASPALHSGDLMALPQHQAFTKRCTEVEINPLKPKDKVAIEADGEYIGVLPATWKIVPSGCQMILP